MFNAVICLLITTISFQSCASIIPLNSLEKNKEGYLYIEKYAAGFKSKCRYEKYYMILINDLLYYYKSYVWASVGGILT